MSTARSRSQVSWRDADVTRAFESGVQPAPLCWNSPGVRLRGVPVPSAATTWTCFGRSKIQFSPLSREKNRSTLRGDCHDSSFCVYRSSCVRLVNAIHRPSGDQVTSPSPSGIAQTVRTSPGPSTGITWRVVSPSLSLLADVKARNRPSGDHAGPPSFGPAVTGTSSSQTRLIVVLFARSMVATTNAVWLPSGGDRRTRDGGATVDQLLGSGAVR